MTDTPNARLARVLRLLADVAERGPLSDKGYQAIGAIWNAHVWEDESLSKAEFIFSEAEYMAAEAARLAGVPVPLPEPYRPEDVPHA